MKLAGKRVVITGAASGIGEACARRFVAEGARVVLTDSNPHVEQVADEVDGVALTVDISQEPGVKAVAELARWAYGDVDIWFSNAGSAGPRQPGELPANPQWEAAWQLHVMSHVYAVREVLPSMLARGEGYLLQTASVVGLTTQLEKAAYTVTKHAALSLSEWLAANYRQHGIRVSCFCPGPMLTPMLLANGFPDDHPVLRTAVAPADVATRLVNAIDDEAFLITDSEQAVDALRARATDYDGWLTNLGSPASLSATPLTGQPQ